MKRFDDLYKILQISFEADFEVIEAAYKSLCKKYHPDISKLTNSEEKMKALNHAYSILKNPEKRKNYDIEYQRRKGVQTDTGGLSQSSEKIHEKQNAEIAIKRAEAIICDYFKCLSEKRFADAYKYLCDSDMKEISFDDFVRWQTLVFDNYEIGDIQCVFYKRVFKQSILRKYSTVYEFGVNITERKLLDGTFERVGFQRLVVDQKAKPAIYLGYNNIPELIAYLEKNIKEEKYSNDSAISFLEVENERILRYGRSFSFALIELCYKSGQNIHKYREQLLIMCKSIVRNTDILHRWDDNKIMIIYTETRVTSAKRAVERIFKKSGELMGDFKGTVNAGIVGVYGCNVKEIIDTTLEMLSLAKKSGNWEIKTTNINRKL